MERRPLKSKLCVATLAVALAGVTALPAFAAGGAAEPVGLMNVAAAVVDWTPVGAGERFVLRVSGPGGFVATHEFAAGANPTFALFDKAGQALPDGVYKYELWSVPQLAERRQLEGARAAGEEVESRHTPRIQSGAFTVRGGSFLSPAAEEAPSGGRPAGGQPGLALRDQVIPDDLIVQGSICSGIDCVNNEDFGFDTIRLKENNTRIQFNDTSTTTGFPTNNWQIRANSSASGGTNFLGFVDQGATGFTETGTLVFAVEAGAAANSLYVDTGTRVGVGTSTPVLNLHVSSSNTPALRLEQTSAGGFTAQTWDIAGNEASFFVRDVTSGSRLPFRIVPGANSNSLFIANNSNVGVGTASPNDKLHVLSTADPTSGQVLIENTSGTALLRTMINMQNNGGVRWQVNDRFQVRFNNNQFQFDNTTNAGNECIIDNVGNLTCLGAKSFAMLDPDDESLAIHYAALEGPEAGTYYRGKARSVNGEAVIVLPDHFSKVTEVEGMTVQLTPVGGWSQLYLVETSPKRIVVRNAQGSSDVEFHFLVQGIRKGYLDYQAVRSSASIR